MWPSLHAACVLRLARVFSSLAPSTSSALNATPLDENGEISLVMGCYGIGVSRLLKLLLLSNTMTRRASWPVSVAPYEVSVLVSLTKTQRFGMLQVL